ncbi:MAG: hypothetical protein NTW78_00965 [Campylobacterales bacterium]|nr:hypothetical protein [Campylobacterales bacterium]
MDIVFLLEVGFGLTVILGLLIFLLVSIRNKRVQINNEAEKKEPILDLQSLQAIIEDEKTTSKELKEALDSVIKNYGVIDEKGGVKTYRHFDTYLEIIFSICLHPNTNKDLIINFERELRKLNPDYTTEIEGALIKGLNSRGV